MRRRTFLKAGAATAVTSMLGVHHGVASGWLHAQLLPGGPRPQDWSNYVRIGAYSLNRENPEKIVREAQASGVFGIEVDNDIPGRYESFLDPTQKLQAIRAVAEKAHSVGNYAFVYIAGTECITANADNVSHTMAKDHPDWLQRKITGEPAIFGGGTAFWISKGDEDVWVSPYAMEWRKLYMERVRQIAATGIDGIYVDIPYWMTHFEGWEESWASFDDHTLAAFHAQTGLDAKKDLKLGDFSDSNFRKWIDFRIQTFTDFMHEIDTTAKSVNSKIKTIPEIYPGIEFEAVRVGADVYSLYPVVDAIAHEYEFGGGDHMASSRTPLDWFRYQVGMHSFRTFAQGKPTWILNYSWDGDKNVDRRQCMMNLSMSQVMAGANFWDAPGHSMAGSNDLSTRKLIFDWIKENEKTLYSPREPIEPIGVYFSPGTRNFYADEYIETYRGVLILLMRAHREFEIVTPRTIAEFSGPSLILPDVRLILAEEKAALNKYSQSGKMVVVVGEDHTGLQQTATVVRLGPVPRYTSDQQIVAELSDVERTFVAAVRGGRAANVHAGPQVATSIARVEGKLHVFFANFDGLKSGVNPVQTPQSGITVSIPQNAPRKGYFLPFLGKVQQIDATMANGETVYVLPAIQKGAVFWCES